MGGDARKRAAAAWRPRLSGVAGGGPAASPLPPAPPPPVLHDDAVNNANPDESEEGQDNPETEVPRARLRELRQLFRGWPPRVDDEGGGLTAADTACFNFRDRVQA